MNTNKIIKAYATVAAAFSLTACVGLTQSPETAPCPAASATQQAVPQNATEAQYSQDTTATVPIVPLDGYRLNVPDSIPAATATVTDTIRMSAPDCDSKHFTNCAIPTVLDPTEAFPALANYIFDYADTLYKAGLADSAASYLSQFSVIKPLWDEWQSKAETSLKKYSELRSEKAKQHESLVLQIQNMNRVHAAYSMVAESADSLISQLAPGDSLANWAKKQKQIAYDNTLKKAQKEFDAIKAIADNQANFEEAKKKTQEFIKYYRDFAEPLQIQAFLDHLESIAQSIDEASVKYWEKHDPAEALAQVDSLIEKGNFAKAKTLLKKLMASKLRKDANAKYQELADAFCNKQRKATSQFFTKAQKQTDEAKKKKLLQDAVAALDKCLEEFPETTQKKKVEDNKKFIEKELAK